MGLRNVILVIPNGGGMNNRLENGRTTQKEIILWGLGRLKPVAGFLQVTS